MLKKPKNSEERLTEREDPVTPRQMESREIRIVNLVFNTCFSPLYVFFGALGVLGNFLAGISQFMYDKLLDTKLTLIRFYAKKTKLPKDGRRKNK